MSQQRFHALSPCVDIALRRFKTVAAVGVELHLHFTGKFRAGAAVLHVLDDMSGPAAVRHERDYRLPDKALPMQE